MNKMQVIIYKKLISHFHYFINLIESESCTKLTRLFEVINVIEQRLFIDRISQRHYRFFYRFCFEH
jgi:hypothetical protein